MREHIETLIAVLTGANRDARRVPRRRRPRRARSTYVVVPREGSGVRFAH
ncbi:hypothetical protein K0817_004040 [Microbacterium sp. HD4P20]|nr:hypothetical protein [Microbacterium sp. HD4P20]MCP2635735.1 hypothetical protein [Microbacterium sp. HD4P20]